VQTNKRENEKGRLLAKVLTQHPQKAGSENRLQISIMCFLGGRLAGEDVHLAGRKKKKKVE
jgi:hypothetical protein